MGLHQRYARLLEGQQLPFIAGRKEEEEKVRRELSHLFDGMMKALYQEEGAEFRIEVLEQPEMQSFVEKHSETLNSSFKQVEMSDTMRRRLERSNYIFSGFKTFHELNEAFPSLIDENGNRKPFEQFLNEVRKIDETYNSNYLRSEYNFIQSSATMAAKWEEFMEDGDRYNLQYRTAGDSKVRPTHAELNRITLPMSDPFWEEFYPPNGWNCFTEGTPVLTSEGWKPIESIRKGDSVIGGSGQFRIVIGTHTKTVDEEVIRIITKGAVATCTKNHRFCTPHGWVMAACLKPGDIIIQVGKNSTPDKIINAICNTYTILRYAFMTFITKGEAASPLTVDHEIHGGDVKVRNIKAKKTARLEFKGFCRKIIKYDFFDFTQWISKSTHALGMKPTRCNRLPHGFFPYFRKEEGGILFKIIRNLTDKITVPFCLALAYMATFKRKFMIDSRKKLTRVQTTQGIVNPLGTHGISTMAKGDISFPQNAEYSPAVNAPVGSKPTGTSILSQIPLFRGITDIHSFNGFNSFYDFLRNTFIHTHYVLVEGKVTKNKAERVVYNLSIDKDESYIVPVGITHNCRCTVVQVRKSKYPVTSHEEAMALGEAALERDTKGIFRFNPGKEEKAVPDYNPYTIRRCRDCDIAKGKLNLSKEFIDENQLCQVCSFLRNKTNQEATRRLNKKERKDIIDATLSWADKHLPRIDMADGTKGARLTVTTSDGYKLHIGKKFFTETFSKCKNSRKVAETMETSTLINEWVGNAYHVGTEDGKHHDFNFEVFRAEYNGREIEFKAKVTEGLIVYLMKLL